jgi:metal-responsive CopG/Arc/MetJ family transcriptional regulator
MVMKKIILSITDDMAKTLEQEKKKRMAPSVSEVIRQILSEYVLNK